MNNQKNSKVVETDKGKIKNFILKNFEKRTVERLKTFEKFAFNWAEKEDHKHILPVLAEMRSYKESKGTMNIIDLWGRKLQRDCLLQTRMKNDKKIVEDFLFLKTKNQFKKNTNPVFLNKKNEDILKNKIQINKVKKIGKNNRKKSLNNIINPLTIRFNSNYLYIIIHYFNII